MQLSSSRLSRLLSLTVATSTFIGTGLAHAATTLPQIVVKSSKVKEGNSGLTNMVFTATLNKASANSVQVDYKTIGRTANVNLDFKSTKGTLVFAPGTTVLTFSVPVIGETKPEDNETFQVHFQNPKNATLRVTDVDGIILNDDGTPAPAPGTGKIVFASANQQGYGLFTMNSDGSNLTRVSNDFNDTSPSWSPDGTKIAFYSYFLNPNTNFYSFGLGVMDADGKNRVQLTNNTYSTGKPVWRGDNKAIIFQTYGTSSGSAGIYSVAIKGGTLTQLTANSYDGTPSVSRTTGKIVFASYSDGKTYTGISQIYSINADGTGRTALTSDTDFSNFNPQISADGKTVVYSKLVLDTYGIYAVGADGKNQRHVVDVFNSPITPILSQDGKKVLFGVTVDNTLSTYVADLAKGGIKDISDAATTPVFSPDGGRVAFVTTRDGNSEIYIMNVDGTKQIRLTTNPYSDTSPDFTAGTVPAPATTTTTSPNAVNAGAAGGSANSS